VRSSLILLCNLALTADVNPNIMLRRIALASFLCAVLRIGFFPSCRRLDGKPQSDESEYARITHSNGTATLSVLSYGRPLLNGLIAVREEYGWKLNLEQGLCFEPRGAETFVTTFPENVTRLPGAYAVNQAPVYVYAVPAATEEDILNRIVSGYNKTGPACQYSVIRQGDGTFAVTTTAVRKSDGTYEPFTPLLDTNISIPDGVERLDAIGKALSATTGVHIAVSVFSDVGYPAQAGPALSGVARDLLSKSIDAEWDLYCDPRLCVVNVSFGRRALYTNSGIRHTMP
jgi:hypothetical protein